MQNGKDNVKWLDSILKENEGFRKRLDEQHLPVTREPSPYAVITCMDPRVNLESVGILPFLKNGEIRSQVRIIRTLGGIAENRSLVVGVFLAGFKEIAVLMHTDCGCSLAYSKIGQIIENMQENLSSAHWEKFKKSIGEPLAENLRAWLHAFKDPKEAVVQEVKAIKKLDFVPDSLIIHGLVYDLSSGKVEVIVNGYE
jgi:carbonic anhydrase